MRPQGSQAASSEPRRQPQGPHPALPWAMMAALRDVRTWLIAACTALLFVLGPSMLTARPARATVR